MGALHNDLSQTRCAAQNVTKEIADGGIGFQDREEFDRSRHSSQRSIEPRQRCVWIARSGERLQQKRNEFG